MRAVVALLVAAGALAAGCGGRSAAEGMTTAPRAEPVTVTVAPVAMRAVERTVSTVGTLAASEQADLASEVEGQVVGIEADLGDRVRRDQMLLRVRGDVTEAKLREAEATVEKATADDARARPLRAQGVISDQEYTQVRWALDTARARRDQLRIELERAAIRSPFDGSVAARRVNVSDYVRAGERPSPSARGRRSGSPWRRTGARRSAAP